MSAARDRSPSRRLIFFAVALLAIPVLCGAASAQALLDPLSLTKYMDPLPIPGVAQPVAPLPGWKYSALP